MAYTNYYTCSPVFTPDQNTRMMETLQNNPLLQNFRFHYIGNSVTITGNETWPLPNFPSSGNVYLDGNLTVSPNAQLQINSGRLQFSPTSKLIVEPTGKLFLYATLTSWCDYWQGVEVRGNAGVGQSILTHGLFRTGKGSTGDNSRVENAVIGVLGQNGGIVDALYLTFHNNNLGSAISNYAFPQPLTKFTGCSFETTIFDKFTTPSGSSRVHLLLFGVKNQLLITSCNFSNANNTVLTNPTICGILSYGSSFKVTDGSAEANPPPSFWNLTYGIYNFGNNNSIISVKKSRFTDCNVGIFAEGAKSLSVYQNRFNMGGMPYNSTPYTLPDQFGTWFRNPFAVLSLTSNLFLPGTFTHINPGFTIGSFAQNTGNFNNVFSQNKYHQIDFANLANENNGGKDGLHYLCNDNFPPQIYDFAVEQDGSIREDQGQGNTFTAGFRAAANTFSYTNGNNGDFSDFSNEGGVVRYYWRNAINEEPLDFLDLNELLTPTGAYCAEREICPEPCYTTTEITGMKAEYYTQKTAYAAALDSANQAQQAANIVLYQQYAIQANAIKDRMDFLVGSILLDEENNTNQPDTVRKWMGNFNLVEADYFVAQNFFDHGRAHSADSVLLVIASKFTLNSEQLQETANMRQILALLTGKDAYALHETTQAALLPYAQHEFSISGAWARSILLHYGNWFPPTYKLPNPSAERTSPSAVQRQGKKTSHIKPNPANQTLQIELPDSKGAGNLFIFNNLGTLIATSDISADDHTKFLDARNWPSGIYFLRVVRGDKLLFVEKFIVQH